MSASRAQGRLNITLDPDDAERVRELAAKHGREYGFLPTAAQIVAGLIRKASAPSSHEADHEG